MSLTLPLLLLLPLSFPPHRSFGAGVAAAAAVDVMKPEGSSEQAGDEDLDEDDVNSSSELKDPARGGSDAGAAAAAVGNDVVCGASVGRVPAVAAALAPPRNLETAPPFPSSLSLLSVS